MNIQEILNEAEVNIIDVREPYEYNVEHVEDALNMPISQFQSYIDEIKKMEGKKVFYCRSGHRSGQAVNFLKGLGVENVFNGGSLAIMNSFIIR